MAPKTKSTAVRKKRVSFKMSDNSDGENLTETKRQLLQINKKEKRNEKNTKSGNSQKKGATGKNSNGRMVNEKASGSSYSRLSRSEQLSRDDAEETALKTMRVARNRVTKEKKPEKAALKKGPKEGKAKAVVRKVVGKRSKELLRIAEPEEIQEKYDRNELCAGSCVADRLRYIVMSVRPGMRTEDHVLNFMKKTLCPHIECEFSNLCDINEFIDMKNQRMKLVMEADKKGKSKKVKKLGNQAEEEERLFTKGDVDSLTRR